jgi:hypothetical protein
LRLSASPNTRFIIISSQNAGPALLELYDAAGATCSRESARNVAAAREAAAFHFPTDSLEWVTLPPGTASPVAHVLKAIGETNPGGANGKA